ncbi:MAG TPA: hypothetical protein VFV87_10790, partial [Pirellulaceae bacterium]|nr:hypothetical protein [Pirellulaceae bacterium]
MLQEKILPLVGPAIGLSLILSLGWSTLAEDAPATAAQNGELQSLLRERRAVLQQAVRHAEEAYRSDQAPLSSAIECQRELAQADLELAGSQEERVSIYKRLVEHARVLEKDAEARFNVGKTTQFDL